MHIEAFERIAKQVGDLKKSGIKFDVVIEGDTHWQQGAMQARFQPYYYEIKNLEQLSLLQQILKSPIPITLGHIANGGTIKLDDFKANDSVTNLAATVTDDRSLAVIRRALPSIKFYSPNVRNVANIQPMAISDRPEEKTEEDITYRYLGTKTVCDMCVPHTSQLYNYLDKGFVYVKIDGKVVITNELTPDTYLVMLACSYNPALIKTLEQECFINFNKAKLFRLKFEKEMTPAYKNLYERVKAIVLVDYEKYANSNLLIKVIKGELPTATYNRIKITKNTANYEGITLEYPGMLEFVHELLIFDDRTDIYTIIGSFISGIIAELEAAKLEVGEDGIAVELVKTFKINGIIIRLKRTTANSRRYVNDIAINMEEVEPVCYRASCFDNQEIFDKFVNSVNTMSLKWHDAIGSGLPVKIHDGLTAFEYKSQTVPMSCPRIRFTRDTKDVYLMTGEGKEDKVRVKLNLAIKKIATLNRKTNNGYNVTQGYSPRNAGWARRELAKILKEACTFEKKTLIVDAEGNPVLADDKKQYTVTSECLLTDEKAAFIGKMAQLFYEKAVQRSKIFLDNAVKQTGARTIEFNGEDHWYVEGTLHKYAVCKKTNGVFNYDTKAHICIVSDGHKVEVGFDATATRLLALKNDSVVVSKVGTLRHG